MSDAVEVFYNADKVYASDHEGGLIWNDSDVAIPWPNDNPILLPKDQELPTLRSLVVRGGFEEVQ